MKRLLKEFGIGALIGLLLFALSLLVQMWF